MRAPSPSPSSSSFRGRLRAHARLRYPLVALAAGLALVRGCAAGAPPSRSVEAIAAALGRAAGGEVSPHDFVWEARGGFLADAFLGRRVLFLARRADTGQRDLYRARVRLTRNGHPLSVDAPHDLTDTPLDDDGDLLAFGHWAAFANRGEAAVRSVTVLDLQGEPGGALAARAERWLDTGSTRGLGRQEVAFAEPPADVRFEITGDEVVLALGAERVPALLDARRGVLTGTAGADHGARAYRLPASPPPSLSAVWQRLAGRVAGAGVGRAASAIGEAARTFAARAATVTVGAPSRLDDWADAAPALAAAGGASWPPASITPPLAPPLPGEGVWVAHTRVTLAPPVPSPAPTSPPDVGPSPAPSGAADDDAPVRDAGAAGTGGKRRPAPPGDAGTAGIEGAAGIEGEDEADVEDAGDAGAAPVVERPAADAPRRSPLPPAPRPPALLRTAVRPDPSDPSTVVRLVAMDTRQVELRWQPGYARPRPLAAPHGDGALSAEQRAIAIATFNGGPIPDASPAGALPGHYGDRALGLVAGGRAGTPPAPGAATLASGGDAGVTFGVWPARAASVPVAQPALDSSARPAGSAGAPPPAPPASPAAPWPRGASSWLRQLPDALHPAPAAPVFPLIHATLRLQRSAFGATASGHLVYAWSARATAAQLAAALRLADCVWVAPLAAAPAGVGFWFLSSQAPRNSPASGEQGTGAPLAASMTLGPEAWSGASRDDFFWLAARPTAPRIGNDDLRFDPDEGTQPEPTWAPAVHVARSPHLGAQVTVVAFAAGRFTFRLGAGTREPKHRNGGTFVSDMPPGSTVIAAIGLGASRRRAPRGLATDGLTGFPFRPESGALLLAERTRPALLPSDDLTVPTGADATELPLTADDGKLRPEGREVGSMRARAAICSLDGTFLVATTTFDSDEATTEALLEVGCRRVLALDRGGHQAAFLHRAGTATPPATRYEVTALYLLAAPMLGTAHPLP